jgi:hypothetical protein
VRVSTITVRHPEIEPRGGQLSPRWINPRWINAVNDQHPGNTRATPERPAHNAGHAGDYWGESKQPNWAYSRKVAKVNNCSPPAETLCQNVAKTRRHHRRGGLNTSPAPAIFEA